MRSLKQRIIVFTGLSVMFLVVQLAVYVHNIRIFETELIMLERSHSFMENVLELRRYEKNFLYRIDPEDVKMVLTYIDKIKKEIAEITNFSVKRKFISQSLIEFNENIIQYEKLVKSAAKSNTKEHVKKIREYGHEMVGFAEKILNVNRQYVKQRLTKIMIIPTISMFLFGGALILFIIFLAVSIVKQLTFIQETTKRIAEGDFSYIPEPDKGHAFPLIIKAFNRMIGELENRQEQLLQARKLASLGTLTSGIAHEINNPLNNILLTAESILEEFDDLNKTELQDMIMEILSEIRRASSVVKNLLDFSRRRKSDDFELLDLGEVIESTLKLVKNQLVLSGIHLKKEIPKNLPLINGNLDSLKQIFINLLLNAIQAMSKGGVLSVSLRKKDNMLEAKVSDTGIGMSPEIMGQIFDPFFSTKPVGKGTGLGLSIVYGLVKKHGGYIEVKSRRNEGTTFFIYFPIAKYQGD